MVNKKEVKIRKARKEDLKNYIDLRKEWDKEYSKMVGRKLQITSLQVKKEFNEILKNKKRILLFMRYQNKIIGFLIANLINNIYSKNNCYIDDVFVIKTFRRKGLGSILMKEFMKLMKKKKVEEILLGVYITNNRAKKMYKKLGFKINYYNMRKKLK